MNWVQNVVPEPIEDRVDQSADTETVSELRTEKSQLEHTGIDHGATLRSPATSLNRDRTPAVITCEVNIISGCIERSVMAGDLTIRRYEQSDAEQVWTVHELALRATPLEFVEDAPADEDVAEITERYLDAGGEFLVGLSDDEIAAIGGFQPRAGDTVEIRRIRVHPEHQRRGYGERLLEALEERARGRGADRIVLDTNERLRAAQNLYEKRGYEETRRETHSITGDEFIYYEKEL